MIKKDKAKALAKDIFRILKQKEVKEIRQLGDLNLEFFFYYPETMAEVFKYTEAKALPELSEIKSHTTIRDFIAAIRSYYAILNDDGKKQLIKFVIQAKILGSAKTKIGAPNTDNIDTLKNLLND
jgi:hypothetical protein